MNIDKYYYYERSVQSSEGHVEWFSSVFKELRGKDPTRLREDFCGTFKLASEWVRQDTSKMAIGLDLDPEPLAYGKKNTRKKLSAHENKRLKIYQQDVLSVTKPGSDIIIACNFSFFIFKARKLMKEYFKSCLNSLNQDGILILETVGGPGIIEKTRETRTIKDGRKKFKYIWHQREFDPINHHGLYSIHFKLPDGQEVKDAFTYDWRIWTIPELRDCLYEAGFKDVRVYWELSHKGEGTDEYVHMEKGDNDFTWISYIVGLKSKSTTPVPDPKSKLKELGY